MERHLSSNVRRRDRDDRNEKEGTRKDVSRVVRRERLLSEVALKNHVKGSLVPRQVEQRRYKVLRFSLKSGKSIWDPLSPS